MKQAYLFTILSNFIIVIAIIVELSIAIALFILIVAISVGWDELLLGERVMLEGRWRWGMILYWVCHNDYIIIL